MRLRLVPLTGVLVLSACASGARFENMVPLEYPAEVSAADWGAFDGAISGIFIVGGRETDNWGYPEVSEDAFYSALEDLFNRKWLILQK